MGDTTSTVTSSLPRARPDFTHVSDVMLYDISRHTASLLMADLLAYADAATEETDRDRWEARLRLVDAQVAALNPENRAGLIAQNDAWDDESYALNDRP